MKKKTVIQYANIYN